MRLIVPKKNDTVRKSDALIKSRYKLNPLALKFITLIIANVKKSDEENKEYVFRIKDFMELVGKNYKELYNELDEATEELLNNPLKIPKERGFLKLNWISSAEYHEGEGYISFKIDSKLRPYIFDLQERFLKYDIKNILPLRSGYAIRMYEILKDWYNQNTRYNGSKKIEKVVEIRWLRETLEIPNSYNYGMMKSRIIEKAKQELEQHTDIKFHYEEIKTGRRVTHIKFTIEPNPASVENKKQEKATKNLQKLDPLQELETNLNRTYKDKSFRGENGLNWYILRIKIADKDTVEVIATDLQETKTFKMTIKELENLQNPQK